MFRAMQMLSVAALFVAGTACVSGRHSAAGFRLPPGGNAERGKVLFVSMGCNTCHEVAGSDLPKPTVRPPVPVVLGGPVDYGVTDGYLVTSIVNPSYELASYPKTEITANGHSRMPAYADQLTVSQLADLVAYLQSQYSQHPVIPQPYF